MFNKIKSGLPVTLSRILIGGILLFLIISSFLAVGMAIADDVTVISNIKEWQHPVKDVLNKHKVILYKVELYNKTYPIFYVRFPYDPWLGHNDKFFKPLSHYREFCQQLDQVPSGFLNLSGLGRSRVPRMDCYSSEVKITAIGLSSGSSVCPFLGIILPE